MSTQTVIVNPDAFVPIPRSKATPRTTRRAQPNPQPADLKLAEVPQTIDFETWYKIACQQAWTRMLVELVSR